jgi:hypothetical protein
MMAAARSLQLPTIDLQQLNELPALHCVYYTHGQLIQPSLPPIALAVNVINCTSQVLFRPIGGRRIVEAVAVELVRTRRTARLSGTRIDFCHSRSSSRRAEPRVYAP